MAFWGVEVRPGKPYTHRHNPSHGRLRICQATLGSCDASTRTVVQCNVGNKTPVILCSLNPKLAEMCHLEIELEEDDEVLFSVLGQSSVHLSGYYLRSSSRCNAGGEEESESYGEDVGESDTDEEDVVSDDSYESDFIDDGDVAISEDKYGSDFIDDSDVCSTPYRHKQEAVERHAGKVERRRRLKKKNQVDNTEDNNDDSPYKPAIRRNAPSIFDSGSEDEDNMPISHSLPKKDYRKASVVIKTENVQPSEDEGKVSMEIKTENDQSNDVTRKKNNARKRKSGAISQDPASPMDLTVVNGSSVSKQEAGVKKKSKKKKRTPLEAEDGKHSLSTRTLENGLIIEDLTPRNLGAKMASSGSKVYISYVGMLQDGKIVESNVGEKPYKFKLGSGEAFFGCDGGICGMHVGDKRRLTISPSMCHGDKAARKIPKNCSIIYEVELVKVR